MTDTHMKREIAEIPEATARLLDQSGAALAEAGAELRALDPRFRHYGRARLVGPRRRLPEIRHRTDGGRAGRLARPVDRLDLRSEAEARAVGQHRDFAIRQKPRHRGHGQGRPRWRRAHHRHHQYRRLTARRRLAPCDRHPLGRREKRGSHQDLRRVSRGRARHPRRMDRRQAAACRARRNCRRTSPRQSPATGWISPTPCLGTIRCSSWAAGRRRRLPTKPRSSSRRPAACTQRPTAQPK